MTELPRDVERISWAAEQLGISVSTAYRLAEVGDLPGAFRVGRQWRVSVPRFLREVHGAESGGPALPPADEVPPG